MKDRFDDIMTTSFTPLRNGFCTTIPILLSGYGTVLPKEASDSVCDRAFRNGFDLCPCSVHSVASGTICLAR